MSDTTSEPVSRLARAAGITIRQLNVEYQPGARILRDLSLDIAPGEIVALVGASGCGKSTLLRAIARLTDCQSGTIELTGSTPQRRTNDLAFVFQDATLLPWRTVWENVRIPLELGVSQVGGKQRSDLGEQSMAIPHLLEAVELPASSYRKFPRQLSGGMKMRASIARALVTDPSILLLDEPFAALDDLLRVKLNDLLLRLHADRRRTIVFVTHNIAEAVYLSHQMVVLGDGRVSEIIPNTLPWPRSVRMRASSAAASLYGKVSAALAEASL